MLYEGTLHMVAISTVVVGLDERDARASVGESGFGDSRPLEGVVHAVLCAKAFKLPPDPPGL